jgi:glycosyltransferase involved in cell wall biosynthesis
MISVIIPAHNEEAVIASGLRSLLDGAQPGELEVIVACNGCTDRTAEIARGFGEPVRVIEISQASKTAALNAADLVATSFPRFYVDADVRINLAAIRRMANVLDSGGALMVTPELRMDLGETSWPVRAFYRVWTALPYNNVGGAVGTGVYALSRSGRARFQSFPDVVADDGFVRFAFAQHERAVVQGAVSEVDPPRCLGSLIRIKTRARLGQYELRKRLFGSSFSDSEVAGSPLGVFLRRPSLWPHLPVYLAVNLIARWRALRQIRVKVRPAWERDETTRLDRGRSVPN